MSTVSSRVSVALDLNLFKQEKRQQKGCGPGLVLPRKVGFVGDSC